MSHCNKKNSSLATPKKTKYNDWTCSLCQNYNYSFRVICKGLLTQAIDATFNIVTFKTQWFPQPILLPSNPICPKTEKEVTIFLTWFCWEFAKRKRPLPSLMTGGTAFRIAGLVSLLTELVDSHMFSGVFYSTS